MSTRRTLKALRAGVPLSDTTACLKYWVLFSLVHFCSHYVTVYMRELKCLLMLGCFMPTHGKEFTAAVYSNTAQPFMKSVGTPAAAKFRTLRRFGQTTMSAMSRHAFSSAVPSLVSGASTEELGHFEVSLENCLASLQQERQRRRTLQLAHSAFWRKKGARQGGAAGKEGKEAEVEDDGRVSEDKSDDGADRGAEPVPVASPTLSEESVPEDEFESLLDEPTGGSWTMVGSESAVKRPADAPGRSLRHRGGRRYKSMPPQPPPNFRPGKDD